LLDFVIAQRFWALKIRGAPTNLPTHRNEFPSITTPIVQSFFYVIGLIYMKPDYEILPHHCPQLLPVAVYMLQPFQ
jgi:hypothetical protein